MKLFFYIPTKCSRIIAMFLLCSLLFGVNGKAQEHRSIQSLGNELWNLIGANRDRKSGVEFLETHENQLVEIIGYLISSKNVQDSLIQHTTTFALDIDNVSPQSGYNLGKALLDVALTHDDTLALSRAHLILGVSGGSLGKLQEALKYLHNVLEFVNENDDSSFYGSVINNLAGAYLAVQDFESSIKYFKETIEIAERNNDQVMALRALFNISAPLMESDQIEEAIEYLERALQKSVEIGDKLVESYALGNLASIYSWQKLPEKAIDYQRRGLIIHIKDNDKLAQIDAHIILASSFASLNNRKKTDEHFEKAIALAKELNTTDKLKDIYRYGYLSYEELGDFESAYQQSLLYHELYDSLHNLDKNDQVAEMREKYETEKKEREIINLQRDNQLASLEIDKERGQKTIFIIASVLFLVIAVSAYLFYHQTKKTKLEVEKRNDLITGINKKLSQSQDALIESNKTKDKFFALIAHDLRGPITSFQGIGRMLQFSLKKNKTEKAEALIESIDESANGINILLDNLLKWSLSQTGSLPFKAERINLKTIAEDTVTIYKQSCEAKNIDLINTINEDYMVKADHNTVSTILRNLLGNAFKFTPEGGKITIDCHLVNDNYELSVSDTGIGIAGEKLKNIFELDDNKTTRGTKGEKGTGLGLMLCKEFVSKNNGEIWVESEEGKGTKFAFSLPLMKFQNSIEEKHLV